MNKLRNKQSGFTLIELIVVIAIIGILAAVAVPAFINVVDNAHAANMDAVEGALRSAAVMFASNELIEGRTYAYPATAGGTIALLMEDAEIVDWTGDANVWTYTPTGGTLTYTSAAGPPSTYDIVKVYAAAG